MNQTERLYKITELLRCQRAVKFSRREHGVSQGGAQWLKN